MDENDAYYTDLFEYNFKKKVLSDMKGLNIVVFNNKQFASNLLYDSILKDIADEFCKDCNFYRINSEHSVTLISQYGINDIPTLLLFNAGQIVNHLYGIHPKSYLRSYISNHLS